MKSRIFLFIFATSIAQAEVPDLLAGKELVLKGNSRGAVACMACHKENGEGMSASGFPQLAGLKEAYLKKQLEDYQNLQRVNPVMQPIAKGLNAQEIRNLAAYFASMPSVPQVEKYEKADVIELGKQIAERGMWSKAVPACFACHGPNAEGVGESFLRCYIREKYICFNSFRRGKVVRGKMTRTI